MMRWIGIGLCGALAACGGGQHAPVRPAVTPVVTSQEEPAWRSTISPGGRERAALHQPTPREQLVGVQPVAAGDKRDGLSGQIGLLDEAHLFLSGPVPPALDRGDHLDAFGAERVVRTHHTVGHRHTLP